MRNYLFDQETGSIFLKGFIFLKEHKNQFKMLLEMTFVPERVVPDKHKDAFLHEKRKMKTVMNVFKAKRAATFRIFLLRIIVLFSGEQNRQLYCLVAMAHLALSKRRGGTTELKNHLLF